SEVMLPQTIDRHSREQRASTLVHVGQPIGKGSPTPGILRTWGRLPLPPVRIAAHQHLQKALRRQLRFLVHVATLQDVGLLEKWRTLRMHYYRSIALCTDHHRRLPAWFIRRVLGELRVARLPRFLALLPPVEEGFRLHLRKLGAAARVFD